MDQNVTSQKFECLGLFKKATAIITDSILKLSGNVTVKITYFDHVSKVTLASHREVTAVQQSKPHRYPKHACRTFS